jgi:hypothetical protein
MAQFVSGKFPMPLLVLRAAVCAETQQPSPILTQNVGIHSARNFNKQHQQRHESRGFPAIHSVSTMMNTFLAKNIFYCKNAAIAYYHFV